MHAATKLDDALGAKLLRGPVGQPAAVAQTMNDFLKRVVIRTGIRCDTYMHTS